MRVIGGEPGSGSRPHSASQLVAAAWATGRGMLRPGGVTPRVASNRVMNSRKTIGSPSVMK